MTIAMDKMMTEMWCRDLDYTEMPRWIEALQCVGVKPTEREYEMFCVRMELKMAADFKQAKIEYELEHNNG
jgi:hypothetical protein